MRRSELPSQIKRLRAHASEVEEEVYLRGKWRNHFA